MLDDSKPETMEEEIKPHICYCLIFQNNSPTQYPPGALMWCRFHFTRPIHIISLASSTEATGAACPVSSLEEKLRIYHFLLESPSPLLRSLLAILIV
jgi:hypothetical protein